MGDLLAAGSERLDADWERTARLMWLHAEINRNPEKNRTPFTPDDFHPYRAKPKEKGIEVDGKEWVAYLASALGLPPQ